jgi:hypothetical protein
MLGARDQPQWDETTAPRNIYHACDMRSREEATLYSIIMLWQQHDPVDDHVKYLESLEQSRTRIVQLQRDCASSPGSDADGSRMDHPI